MHCLRVALLARLTRLRLSARPNRSSGFTMHYNLVRGVSSGEAVPGEQPSPPPPDMVSYCDSLVPAHTSLAWMTDEQDMMMMEAVGQPVDQTSDDGTTPQQGDAVLTPHVCTARVLRSGKRPLRPCSGIGRPLWTYNGRLTFEDRTCSGRLTAEDLPAVG